MVTINNMSSKTLVKEQYKSTDKLDLRKSLHEKYSVNKVGLQKWMFEKYPFRPGMKILELGSGTGGLWDSYFESDRLQRYDMDITVSDFSDGMVEHLQKKYSGRGITVRKVDITEIPFGRGTFDLAIANSMLYHVKDVDRAIAEVKRVLKKDGLFYCATFGRNGMMQYLYHALDEVGISYDHESKLSFTLQNGAELLKRHFGRVERLDYEDALAIDNIEDYLEYIYSMASMQGLGREHYETLRNYFDSRKENGYLHIPKEYGMFVAGEV